MWHTTTVGNAERNTNCEFQALAGLEEQTRAGIRVMKRTIRATMQKITRV